MSTTIEKINIFLTTVEEKNISSEKIRSYFGLKNLAQARTLKKDAPYIDQEDFVLRVSRWTDMPIAAHIYWNNFENTVDVLNIE
ncbi:MAG: hypothetical protein WBB28_01365 [Crinalium sp.]